MTRSIPRSAALIAGLLAGSAAFAAAAPAAPPPGASQPVSAGAAHVPRLGDPAAEWKRFLATSSLDEAVDGHQFLVGMYSEGVLAEGCASQLDALDAEIRKVPVSAMLWHSGEACARKAGDAARADAYAAGFESLAAYALSRDTGNPHGAPIPVLSDDDMNAIVAATGMRLLYSYHDLARGRQFYATAVALWDDDAKTERHLSFDFLDVLEQLRSNEDMAGYPIHRIRSAEAVRTEQVKEGDDLALDLAASVAFRDASPGPARFDKLRATAAAGGVVSLRAWMAACDGTPMAECSGLVDALLPLAEQGLALYRIQLALAYARGIGVHKDVDAAMVLVDSAAKRWGGGNAVARFAEDWNAFDDALPPSPVMDRLAKAAAAGSQRARAARMELLVDAVKDRDGPLDKAASDAVAELAAAGYAPAQMHAFYDFVTRKQEAEAVAVLRRAAAQEDADAMTRLARRMLDGRGMPRDRIGGLAMMRKAARAGDSDAMSWMGWYASRQRQWKESEAWLLSSISYDNVPAMLELLETYQLPGASPPTPDRMKALYETVLKYVDTPAARRSYAKYLSSAPAKDAPRARALLEQDAKTGDAVSSLLLGMWMLDGRLGKADADAAMKWVDAALTHNEDAGDSFAHYLYYRQRTPQARQRAFSLERGLVAKDRIAAKNNLAWWLCTSEDAGLRAPVEGLAVARAMGEAKALDFSRLDTLAACEAANGLFTEAIAHEQGVVEEWAAYPPSSHADGPALRLALYRQSKPYVESRADEYED